MSRIAKKPIELPANTQASYAKGTMSIKGPLGELKKYFKDDIDVKIENNSILLTPTNKTILARALWGTYAAHIRNMIAGVNKPFEKRLIIEGIGFKGDIKGKDLVLSLGFSHQIVMPIPADIKVVSEKNTLIITSIDKESVGEFASKIRSLKKPEPYLGKGVRYSDEVIRRKQGKKAA